MSAQWLSRRQFAQAEGCDEKQVRRGLERGTLVARADGKLDAAQVGSGWRRLRVDSREGPKRPPVAAPAAAAPTPAPAEVPETLTAAEIHRRLQRLDYATEPADWSDAAVEARLHQAARCVGLVALRSDLRDDGHHGGFQLRHAEHGGSRIDGQILAGFGFELEPWEAIAECRHWATGVHQWGGGLLFPADTEQTILVSLLPHLAFPVLQGEPRRLQDAFDMPFGAVCGQADARFIFGVIRRAIGVC